mgnify:CR=1 FL=1
MEAGRLEGKVALVFGASQAPCDYDLWGNGRATAVTRQR